MGQKFFLEEWEVYDKNNINEKEPILQFDKNLLVSQIKKNPYDDYIPLRILGTGA
jgi:hypothetical protein